MKIGEKKQWKKGRGTFTLERIKFDWIALLIWLIIGLVAWFIWFR